MTKMRWARLIVILVCIGVGVGIIRSVLSLSTKKSLVEERREVQKQLEAKRVELENQLKEATSAAFIEKVARDKLGLVREGETVVIMGKPSAISSQPSAGKEETNWRKWWGLFF